MRGVYSHGSCSTQYLRTAVFDLHLYLFVNLHVNMLTETKAMCSFSMSIILVLVLVCWHLLISINHTAQPEADGNVTTLTVIVNNQNKYVIICLDEWKSPGDVNMCTEEHGNPPKSCWGISTKVQHFGFMLVAGEKLEDDQGQQDNISEEHDWLI